jgi:hypothetical protein
MAFRVVEHRPFLLALDKSLLSNGADGCLEVRDLKKQDRLVL